MGRSEKKALRSNLEVVVMHLLKCKYQIEKRSGSWRATIREQILNADFYLSRNRKFYDDVKLFCLLPHDSRNFHKSGRCFRY
ncbi:DUF29 family protein [Nostoc punctiforme FACHB-252]|uniref:DUF29 family protein n=1 Tax=Nostoc punctiforme FACHB-252 TaxID=1357509 RepID=A0ABR8HGE0_NOSPU|nr:DUF29 family protein [Nostoc punctiforme FACHB-252]